jgi:hypothetical protein
VVKIIALLELEQKLTFFKGLGTSPMQTANDDPSISGGIKYTAKQVYNPSIRFAEQS